MGPEPDSNIFLTILILLLFTFLNAFFVLCESAILNVNIHNMNKKAEEGDKRAKRILQLMNQPKTVTTYQVLTTMFAFFACAFAYQKFAPGLIDWLETFMPIHHTVLSGFALVIIAFILLIFYLIFGVMIPRRIGIFRADGVAIRVSGIYHGVCILLFPITWILYTVVAQISRIFGVAPDAKKKGVTEEGILTMVDKGEETGAILENEKELITKIFEFNDTTASDIATHRTDVVAVEDTVAVSDIVQLSLKGGYSRVPVYHEDLDNIIGIVYVKDLLKYVGNHMNNATSVTDIMRKPYFVPETKLCSELFAELSERKIQIAVVIDEYGGTAGIVTMEDILESIVGNMEDEYDREDQEIVKIDETTYRIKGIAPIDKVSNELDIGLSKEDHDTIGGFVVELLGHLPREGEHPTITYQHVQFTVELMKDNRIATLLVELLPKATRTEQTETAEPTEQ